MEMFDCFSFAIETYLRCHQRFPSGLNIVNRRNPERQIKSLKTLKSHCLESLSPRRFCFLFFDQQAGVNVTVLNHNINMTKYSFLIGSLIEERS